MQRGLPDKRDKKRVMALVLAALFGLGMTTADGEAPAQSPDWRLVRSVENPLGGTIDFIVIPKQKQRDKSYQLPICDEVCGDRTACVVHFWTDPMHVPESGDMPVADLSVMTATYERHPSYSAPVFRLACWLYSEKELAVRENCFVMPGAVVPWEE